MEKYDGFVYLWFDTARCKFYLGSHRGTTTDGYVGSGLTFRKAYRKRPHTFRRRILEYVVGDTYKIQSREQVWLNLIDDEELGDKYYNIKKIAMGGSKKGHRRAGWSKERRIKTINSLRGRKKTEEYKNKLSSVVAKTYTFHNLATGDLFSGSVREFAVKFFSLNKRPSIAHSAYFSKRYKGWFIYC